eukprot:366234-Chlamydomonas_euryale.AAC.9
MSTSISSTSSSVAVAEPAPLPLPAKLACSCASALAGPQRCPDSRSQSFVYTWVGLRGAWVVWGVRSPHLIGAHASGACTSCLLPDRSAMERCTAGTS